MTVNIITINIYRFDDLNKPLAFNQAQKFSHPPNIISQINIQSIDKKSE